MINAEFNDENLSEVIGVFSCAQPAGGAMFQGEIETDDPRYLQWLADLPAGTLISEDLQPAGE